MKRIWRELSDSQKKLLSQQAKGRRKSYDHRRHISLGMKKYWQKIPHMPGMDDTKDDKEKTNNQNDFWG